MISEHPYVLLIDDEQNTLHAYSAMLRSEGIKNISTISDSRDVIPHLSDKQPAAIVLDLYMPHISGLELLSHISKEYPYIPVMVITAADEVDTAVESMKSGSFDYIVKPVDKTRFITSVKKAMEFRSLKREVSSLKHYMFTDKLQNKEAFASIITQSSNMKAIFKYTEAIAPSNQPLLITGETGVGKELIARAVHTLSNRAGSFIVVNIAGLDDTVFSDTLFGHAAGAFTGAHEARAGLISKASGGTLFLDEIGDLDMSSQVKLLRLMQDGTYYPLGSDYLRESDARIIVATNRGIKDLKRKGNFRKDLYYRLKTHHIHIPPLKARIEDVPLLLDSFLSESAESMGKKKPTPPPELSILLSVYSYPGNVRELKSMVYDAVARHQSGKLSMTSFKEVIELESFTCHDPLASSDIVKGMESYFGRFPTLKEVENRLLEEALSIAKGNQSIAAFLLGTSRLSLNKKLLRNGNNREKKVDEPADRKDIKERVYTRLPANIEISYRLRDKPEEYPGTIVNLSETGIFISTKSLSCPSSFPLDTQIELLIPGKDKLIILTDQMNSIIWKKPESISSCDGIGMKLSKPPQDYLGIVENLKTEEGKDAAES